MHNKRLAKHKEFLIRDALFGGSRQARSLLGLCCGALLVAAASGAGAANQTDGEALRAELLQRYPSLLWVERYRLAYPADAQGSEALWRDFPAPALTSASELTDALVALQDQHVALAGPQAGKQETLGVLFRSSSDGAMAIWRHLDASVTSLADGEQVLEVDGLPAARWLEHAAARTFGGNRRSRMAEAALKLGVSTPADHAATGLAHDVRLTVRGANGQIRKITLPYQPVTAETGATLALAVERSDLPEVVQAAGNRVGVVRFGAFAPQYDAEFTPAANAAEKLGATGDGPMLAGFCAVVGKRLAQIDALAARSDLLLIDLRGNLGGYAREARLLARALTPRKLASTYDVFPGSGPGRLKLVEQADDLSCGSIATPRPLLVWTDAGTRSAGEFMATWLWSAGAISVGERTIGAGGGRDSESAGVLLPQTGLRVKYSGNFSVFDNGASVRAGDMAESELVDLVAQDGFAPSRMRPFAIQAVGLTPDLPLPTSADDLSDGGVAAIERMMTELLRRKLLPGIIERQGAQPR